MAGGVKSRLLCVVATFISTLLVLYILKIPCEQAVIQHIMLVAYVMLKTGTLNDKALATNPKEISGNCRMCLLTCL